ncbi:Glyoxalase/Bleomycin resistance protein/Dihydroxybiphenyl dioxygenase [Truncatella angustata]|uniref:Glyoxalase/Bleomycin resistance protein/Dihydroxybiphenyl dioxygenase n=1 Tax=Truncatella angustata TaxID=152316 RepID=A0A9P9A1K1_9PEZI|nr:Glyoxalase/Bleomycin resistance protein/Dihydroxybiphenyl dioxygenase [Truncatella angustata]KAH6657065.1 Glyoxalase/Bleomycin resistance protein/Dihydroxybiphenyl dioxygenase [Truncatella angustata]
MATDIKTSVPSKVLSPNRLAHVVLRTNATNFKPMVAFYKTFLGAHASYENEMLSFLTYDEEHHRIAIAGLPNTAAKLPGSAGMDHVAFAFNNIHDLTLSYQQRKDQGILPIWCTNHGPTLSMYYRDPDGNKVEAQVDVFDTPEGATAFMTSPEFAENPVGVDFDPEDIIRRLSNGEDEKLVMKRPNVGLRRIDAALVDKQ